MRRRMLLVRGFVIRGCLSNTAGIIKLRRLGGCGKFGPRLAIDIKSEL
jgi:hypothetical protein